MARVVIHKKRHLRLEAIAAFTFIIAIILSLATNLFVRSINVNLSIKIQDMQNECLRLRQENRLLDNEIKGLMNKERVIKEADKKGLKQIENNVISVVQDNN